MSISKLTVRILEIDTDNHRMRLTIPSDDIDKDSQKDYQEYVNRKRKRKENQKESDSSDRIGTFGELIQASLKKI